MREVTLEDFIMPEYRGKNPEDYERREDGKIVRKDRWETAVHQIREIVNVSSKNWEVGDVVAAVENIVADLNDWNRIEDYDDLPEKDGEYHLRLEDGSILRKVVFNRQSKSWTWLGATLSESPQAWRDVQ